MDEWLKSTENVQLFEFLLMKIENVQRRLISSELNKEFREYVDVNRTTLNSRMNRFRVLIQKCPEMDHTTKVKLLFGLKVKINGEFRAILERDALVKYDKEGHIELYEKKDGSLLLKNETKKGRKMPENLDHFDEDVEEKPEDRNDDMNVTFVISRNSKSGSKEESQMKCDECRQRKLEKKKVESLKKRDEKQVPIDSDNSDDCDEEEEKPETTNKKSNEKKGDKDGLTSGKVLEKDAHVKYDEKGLIELYEKKDGSLYLRKDPNQLPSRSDDSDEEVEGKSEDSLDDKNGKMGAKNGMTSGRVLERDAHVKYDEKGHIELYEKKDGSLLLKNETKKGRKISENLDHFDEDVEEKPEDGSDDMNVTFVISRNSKSGLEKDAKMVTDENGLIESYKKKDGSLDLSNDKNQKPIDSDDLEDSDEDVEEKPDATNKNSNGKKGDKDGLKSGRPSHVDTRGVVKGKEVEAPMPISREDSKPKATAAPATALPAPKEVPAPLRVVPPNIVRGALKPKIPVPPAKTRSISKVPAKAPPTSTKTMDKTQTPTGSVRPRVATGLAAPRGPIAAPSSGIARVSMAQRPPFRVTGPSSVLPSRIARPPSAATSRPLSRPGSRTE